MMLMQVLKADVNENGTQEVELAISLKYLGNFWRAAKYSIN